MFHCSRLLLLLISLCICNGIDDCSGEHLRTWTHTSKENVIK